MREAPRHVHGHSRTSAPDKPPVWGDGAARWRRIDTEKGALQYPLETAHISEALAWQEVRDGNAHAAIAWMEPILQTRETAGVPAYPAV